MSETEKYWMISCLIITVLFSVMVFYSVSLESDMEKIKKEAVVNFEFQVNTLIYASQELNITLDEFMQNFLKDYANCLTKDCDKYIDSGVEQRVRCQIPEGAYLRDVSYLVTITEKGNCLFEEN